MRAAASRHAAAARQVTALSATENRRAAVRRARRCQDRAFARCAAASWSGDWDESDAESPAYAEGDEEEEDAGLSEMRFDWADWLNRVRSGHAAQQRLQRCGFAAGAALC